MIRFLDVLFSLLAIIVLIPFMIPIIIGLKLTGEHDVFYSQERIGRYGMPFNLLKFATMMRNSPNMPGGLFTSENDPRILPLGRFLRKTKINELPQLINILKGDMSIIGYRPTVKSDFDRYPDKEKIQQIRPGLSGIGSIVFRDEETILQEIDEKEKFYDEFVVRYKSELEAWYVDHQSVSLYFKLIILTVEAVLFPKSHRWLVVLKGIPPIPDELRPYLIGEEQKEC